MSSAYTAYQIAIRLYSFGLVAFSTKTPLEPRDLKILVLDALRTPVASDGCPIHSHRPALLYQPQRPAVCHEPCESWQGFCRCPLERVRVTFGIGPGCVPLSAGYPPNRTLCEQMATLVPKVQGWPAMFDYFRPTYDVRPECLFDPARGRYGCDGVIAQANFVPEAVFACGLAGGGVGTCSDSTEGHGASHAEPPNSSMMWGRPIRRARLSRGGLKFGARPMATQIVLGRRIVVDPNADEAHRSLRVDVKAFDGTEVYSVLIPPQSCESRTGAHDADPWPDDCIDLAIVNIPDSSGDFLAPARCRDHAADRDFELYEDIVNGHKIEDRYVPIFEDRDECDDEPRDKLCDSPLLESLDRWSRTGSVHRDCPMGVTQ